MFIFSVAGGWSVWSTWSSCDTNCGVGTSHRRRDCTNPVPSATGRFCLGDSIEYKSCQGTYAGIKRLQNEISSLHIHAKYDNCIK